MYVCSVISHPYFDGLSDPLTSMLFVNIYVNLTSKPFLNNSKVKRVNTTSVQPLNWERNTYVQLGEFLPKVINPPENTYEYIWIQ